MDELQPLTTGGIDVSATREPVPSLPKSFSRFRAVPWSGINLLIGLLPLLAYVGYAFVIQSVFVPIIAVWLTIVLFLEAWLVLYPIWVAKRRDSNWSWKPRAFGRLLLEAILAAPMTIAIICLLSLTAWGLYQIAGAQTLPQDVFENARLATEIPFGFILWLITACTWGPIAEEIFFRGFVYNALRRYIPWILALFLQALLFALLHFQPFMNLVYIFIMGIFLGMVYDWRKTIVAPIYIHVFFNSIMVLCLLLGILINANAPVLGVNGADRGEQHGCVLTTVLEGSAADKAGLKLDDVIVAIDDEGIWDFRHLIAIIRSRKVGQTVTIKFYRNDVLFETKAVLQERSVPSR